MEDNAKSRVDNSILLELGSFDLLAWSVAKVSAQVSCLHYGSTGSPFFKQRVQGRKIFAYLRINILKGN